MRKFTEGLIDTKRIVETLDIQPGQTIVDAGCGTGYMAKIFSRAVTASGKVCAVDRDSYFIEKLSEETTGTPIEAILSSCCILLGLFRYVFSQRQIKSFDFPVMVTDRRTWLKCRFKNPLSCFRTCLAFSRPMDISRT